MHGVNVLGEEVVGGNVVVKAKNQARFANGVKANFLRHMIMIS